MLLDKHYSLTNQILEGLQERGVTLKVRSGSPLSRLMDVSYQENAGNTTMHKDLAGVNRHDVTMEAIVKLGADTIRTSIYRARNVVRPIVNDIVQEIMKTTETSVLDTMTYDIRPVAYPAAYDAQSLEALVSVYAKTAPIDAELPRDLRPVLSAEDLAKYSKLNIKTVDDAMEEIYATNPGIQASVFHDLFNGRSWRWMEDHSTLLVAYVMSRGLLNHLNEWDETTSTALKVYLSALVAMFGKKIHIKMTRREAARARKAIIVNVNDKVIEVNADVYNDWLKDGGLPEVVIGCVIAGNVTATAATLEREGEYFMKSYKSYKTVTAGSIASTKRDIMTRIIRKELLNIINTDEVFKESNGSLAELLIKNMNQMVLNQNDPYEYVLKLVCNTLYPETDALKILLGIDELTDADETIDARQAAAAVFHRLTVEWLVSQVEVVNA